MVATLGNDVAANAAAADFATADVAKLAHLSASCSCSSGEV